MHLFFIVSIQGQGLVYFWKLVVRLKTLRRVNRPPPLKSVINVLINPVYGLFNWVGQKREKWCWTGFMNLNDSLSHQIGLKMLMAVPDGHINAN